MEWQPIETAPVGERVELGRYNHTHIPGQIVWETELGTAWEWRGIWPFKRKVKNWRVYGYSHWRKLPEPPK